MTYAQQRVYNLLKYKPGLWSAERLAGHFGWSSDQLAHILDTMPADVRICVCYPHMNPELTCYYLMDDVEGADWQCQEILQQIKALTRLHSELLSSMQKLAFGKDLDGVPAWTDED